MNGLKRLATLILIAAWPLHAGAAGAPPPKPDNTASTTASKPVYKPPLRGAPAGRIGGGTRGATDRESFSLMVLAPDHVGYSTQDRPCLYWYTSRPTPYAVELTVTERQAVKPLVEKVLKGPDKGGIQRVCLAELDVRLQPNVPYKWFVTLVTDAEHRSKDIMAGGIVEVVKPTETLSARLAAAESGKAPLIYAEEGFWYDAIGSLSKMIAATPADADLVRQRASLLEQVGLGEVSVAGER